MKELTANIWTYHKKGHWIVITTNGYIKKNGKAVMGRGIAKQAMIRFPKLPKEIGHCVTRDGNVTHMLVDYHIFTLPVKHNWWEKADIKLIKSSIKGLVWLVDRFLTKRQSRYINESPPRIYLVRPGCGNGQLDWEDVRPICEKYLDDRFVIVEKE